MPFRLKRRLRQRVPRAPASVALRDAQPKDGSSIDDLRQKAGRMDYETILDDDRQKLVVAELAGRIVGYIHTRIKASPLGRSQNPRNVAEVDSAALHPLLLGNEIGLGMIERALAWATDKGADHEITLDVFRPSSIALRLPASGRRHRRR